MVDSVIPRLREASNISDEDVICMVSTTALDMLRWHEIPKPVESEPEKMECYFCRQFFIPGNHFEKYNFVYCSSKCLSNHRKENYERKHEV